jgi:hypothetical protein
MPTGSDAARVSDLHKSAFWIYGVTAMVMREPLAGVIRHIASAGAGDVQVRLEILRVAIVLALMSRLFLTSGLYFDEVYLRPDSAARFPRRSYPVDFISGLLHFLLAVCASTAVSAVTAMFPPIVLAFLLYECLWYVASRLFGFATVTRIAGFAATGLRNAVLCAGVWTVMRMAAGSPEMAEEVAFAAVLGLTFYDIARLLRAYGQPAASAAAK